MRPCSAMSSLARVERRQHPMPMALSMKAVMATAGHRSMQTTKGYLHLAGTVFPDDAANLERGWWG